MSTKTVGFIGLGRMGGGMALNLLGHVDSLYVYDQHAPAVKALTEAGAMAADNPADIASRCSVIFLCLPFAPEVRDAMFSEHGICDAKPEGLTVVDTTTLNRADAIDIASKANEAGIEYWDCPVSGMPFRAADGTLTTMFGGTEAAFKTLSPLLHSFSQDVVHCGDLGTGQAMKAINNVIYNVNIVAICEMLPFATAVGLDKEAVAQVVTTASARSFASEYFVPRMLDRQFDHDFAMGDAYKDIVNVQQMALENDAMLPVVNAMIASYQQTMAAGYADEPKSAMIKRYEQALGVEFSRD